MQQQILMQDLELWVHLGCSAEEQLFTQPVHVSFQLDLNSFVKGSETDQLSDTIDYVELSEISKKIGTAKKYHLVEHLNHSIFSGILTYLKSKKLTGTLKVSVKKIRVPVENLKNGVVVICQTQF